MGAKPHLGTQGWNYDQWVGPFYPRAARQTERLSIYAKAFDTVEVDSAFYGLPSEKTVISCREQVPPGFLFSVKLPSEITHRRRLTDCDLLLRSFSDRFRLLGDKLGCALIQLPPDFSVGFLDSLPGDIRFAIEFRDQRWLSESVLSELRCRGVALALTDGRWIDRELSLALVARPTASFAYVRWLGTRRLKDISRVQINRSRELKQWAEALGAFSEKGAEIFGYFNDHYQGHAPASCNELKRLLGLPTYNLADFIIQPPLFQ
jgi:uncharacterized protein YecE (DUF72 family)